MVLTAAANKYLTETGPGTPMGEYFRRFWVPVLLSKKLPEPGCPPVRVTIMSEPLVAFRDGSGRIGLIDAYCAHRRASLFYGRTEEDGLRCVYHGWKFGHEGHCLDMPNEPAASRIKDRIHITAYPTYEAGDLVWAYLGPPDLRAEIPDLDFMAYPSTHRYIESYLLEANYLQIAEGDHDSSHVGFLHSNLDGSHADLSPHGAKRKLTQVHLSDRSPTLFVLQTAYGFMTAARRDAGPDHYYWRVSPWLAPFYSIVPAEPGSTIAMNIRVPCDDESSWAFRITYAPHRPLTREELDSFQFSGYRYPPKVGDGTDVPLANKRNDYLIDRHLQRYKSYTGIKATMDQDRAVTEDPPIIDRTREHLTSADAGLLRLRKCLLRGAEGLESGQHPEEAGDGSRYRVRGAALMLPREVPIEEGVAAYMACETWAPMGGEVAVPAERHLA